MSRSRNARAGGASPSGGSALRGRPALSDDALVLRRYRYGESSLVVHALSRAHGRVHLLAKGAYRSKSAICGVIDLFDTLEIGWKEAPGGALGVLVAGRIVERRARLARRLDHYRTALTVLEVAGLGAREGQEERELFALVEDVLDALVADEAAPELLGTAFELGFLTLQGLAPALARCAACGEAVPDARGSTVGLFSIEVGGRLCERCAAGSGAEVERVPLGLLRVARSMLATPVRQLGRVQLDSERSRRLQFFVRRFLEYHLDTRPRSFEPTKLQSRPTRRSARR